MAAIVRGVLRRAVTASTTGRQRYLHNTSNKNNLEMEKTLRELELMVEKEVANKVKKMTIMYDTECNPFRRFYNILGIPNNAFKPSSFLHLNLFFICALSFTLGVQAGRDQSMSIQKNLRKFGMDNIAKGNASLPNSMPKGDCESCLLPHGSS